MVIEKLNKKKLQKGLIVGYIQAEHMAGPDKETKGPMQLYTFHLLIKTIDEQNKWWPTKTVVNPLATKVKCGVMACDVEGKLLNGSKLRDVTINTDVKKKRPDPNDVMKTNFELVRLWQAARNDQKAYAAYVDYIKKVTPEFCGYYAKGFTIHSIMESKR